MLSHLNTPFVIIHLCTHVFLLTSEILFVVHAYDTVHFAKNEHVRNTRESCHRYVEHFLVLVYLIKAQW